MGQKDTIDLDRVTTSRLGDDGDVEAPAEVDGERYQRLILLGEGGMGEVFRVRDRLLRRSVAMKVLRAELLSKPRALQRFREEAEVAAQLQHPGIVPVLDLGRLDDGRVWFTMPEIRGTTLFDRIWDHHSADDPDPAELHRLVHAYHRVLEAVAYAHDRGVIHRDLKPENVMIGPFGEVLVLDWGLARVLAEPDISEPVETSRSGDPARRTRVGAITGTPVYMAPEQARGETDKIGTAADVYALGVTLYEILTGEVPHDGDPGEVLQKVAAATPVRPPSALCPVDEVLEAIVLKALQPAPEDRFSDASALAARVGRWLDGAARRERALEVVDQARDEVRAAEAAQARARHLRSEADAALDAVDPRAPEDVKAPLWDQQDEARAAERAAEAHRVEATRLARAALAHAPDLDEAHQLLADDLYHRHAALEAEGRTAEARAVEGALRAHDRGRYRDYLRGEGAVTLVTDPPDATVTVFRYEERRRRLVLVETGVRGETPLEEVPLPMGSYLLRIEAEGCETVRYPVLVERLKHWDGVRPGSTEPLPIRLPRVGELAGDDCYVPAGRFWSEASSEAISEPYPRRWLWCDGFVVKRDPVTNGEYVAWLNALAGDQAEKHVPRMRSGEAVYGRDGEGRWVLGPDSDGFEWGPDLPVVGIDWSSAVGYAEWRAEQDGVPWRLAWELEWEKAARGVDGRLYPWGSEIDPTWAWIRESWTSNPGPRRVGEHPVDTSPFGVRGLAGNVIDWTADRRPGVPRCEGDLVVRATGSGRVVSIRGGSWNTSAFMSRVDFRRINSPTETRHNIGFRLFRSIFEGDAEG